MESPRLGGGFRVCGPSWPRLLSSWRGQCRTAVEQGRGRKPAAAPPRRCHHPSHCDRQNWPRFSPGVPALSSGFPTAGGVRQAPRPEPGGGGRGSSISAATGERSIFHRHFIDCLLCDMQPATCRGPRRQSEPTVLEPAQSHEPALPRTAARCSGRV